MSLELGAREGILVHGDMLLGAVAGYVTHRPIPSQSSCLGHRVLVLTIAAELAVHRGDVKGPGTFFPALIDEIWTLTPDNVQVMARVEVQ